MPLFYRMGVMKTKALVIVVYLLAAILGCALGRMSKINAACSGTEITGNMTDYSVPMFM